MTQMIRPVIRSSFGGLAGEIAGLPKQYGRALLVGDSNTMPLYGEEVKRELLKVIPVVRTCSFPAGEENKNLDTVRSVLEVLIRSGFDRGDVVCALGGGVVGDLAGFAASVYLRGIDVIQLPTTLLSQIDSSIGGKTGVDFDGYKNMVGAFHMPALVYTNPSALVTLPSDQFSAGMGEVIKSALLADADFYVWLKERADAVLSGDPDTLYEMIRRTAEIKVRIVEEDPKEKGVRALLNLGHTIGHAIEKTEDFRMLHGSCVALGLMAAASMSRARGYLTEKETEDIRAALVRFGLPVRTEIADPDEILRATKSDKKMAAGQIRFILLEKIGRAAVARDVSDEEILAGIRSVSPEDGMEER